MTELEYRAIDYLLDNLESQEARMCARYIELNPDDAQRRQRDAAIYTTALHTVRSHIREIYSRKATR